MAPNKPKYIETHRSEKVQKATWTNDLHRSGAAISHRHEKAWTKHDGERTIGNHEAA